MLNVLYIGPNDSEWAQMNRPVSLAAAKWARGFLTALSKFCNLTVLTHTYEVAWPKGKVFWRGYDARLYPTGWACEAVSYPVLKHIREIWWRFAYAAKAKRIVREKKIDVVLMYNCDMLWHAGVLRAIRKCSPDVKIFPILLDGNDPRKDNWFWMRRAAKYADGFIALSWWMYQNLASYTNRKVFHMDGGADQWRGTEIEESEVNERPRQHILVHTGELDEWRGLNFMMEIVKDLTSRRRDVKFVFCGKSCVSRIKEVFGQNPQVELPGFVTEDQMREICNSADILLNVRNPSHPDNILNYPSKIPHYLSFGRPVVSTRLQSLSPNYDEIIHYPENTTVASYVAMIERILSFDLQQRRNEYNNIKTWFNQNKRWDIVVSDLFEKISKGL